MDPRVDRFRRTIDSQRNVQKEGFAPPLVSTKNKISSIAIEEDSWTCKIRLETVREVTRVLEYRAARVVSSTEIEHGIPIGFYPRGSSWVRRNPIDGIENKPKGGS